MVQRQKMYLVSSAVDESIKSSTPVYNITIFKAFVDFEKYVEGTPLIVDTLIITTDDIQFTSTNMTRLVNIISSPFFQLNGTVIYVIDETYDESVVSKFFSTSGITDYAIYQGKITTKYITDIITGEARRGEENTTVELTFIVRSDEYAKMRATQDFETTDNKYISDEDDLSEVPDEEEPIETAPSADIFCEVVNIAGLNCNERTLFAFLSAQYLSITGKTIIIEHDVGFHILTEMVTKSGISYLDIPVSAIYDNINEVLSKIKDSPEKLIVLSSVDRISYDYSFMFDLLFHNLKENVMYMIRECGVDEVPYGTKLAYVCRNMVPDILKLSTSISLEVIPENTLFIGMQLGDLDEICINSEELVAIVSSVMCKNGIIGQVFKAKSLLLKGSGGVNDIFGIISRIIGG